MAKLLGQRSCTPLAGIAWQDRQAQTQSFSVATLNVLTQFEGPKVSNVQQVLGRAWKALYLLLYFTTKFHENLSSDSIELKSTQHHLFKNFKWCC